jgi:tetratricopeptide (TPR) repeat protein
LLAYHFALAENWRKALQYLLKAGDEAGKVAADTEALTHYQEALKAYTKQSDNKLTAMERATLERKMGEALFRRGEHRQAAEYLHRALSCLNTSYPKSSGAVRMAVLSNIFVQASHRLIPRFSKNSQRMADDAAADRSWILEMLGWMDYFGNQERFVLDALLALNLDERDNYEPGVARDSTAVGLITDLLPLHGLGHFYHQRAVTLAEQIQHPVAMGLAYLGRGLHHHHRTGRWTAAVEDYRRSIAAYKNAGHLRGWGGALWWFAWLQFMQGELATAMQCFSDIMQVGSDVADRQVYGWGLRGVGRLLSERGQWSEAVTHLQQGIDVLQTVPDYSSVARTMSTLGLCYLHQGKIEEGLVLVEKSQALVVKQRLYGFLSSETRLAVPEAYLFAAELGKGSRRESSLAMAAQACRLALQQTRVDREAGPGAFRYRGVLEWLQGNPKQAEQWWRKSIDTARQLGARYELAKVYLEMGLRAAPRHYLDEGKKLFEEVGEGASHLLTTDLGIVESEHHAKVN